MATILDVGILTFLVPVLVLVFVFLILYGLFEKIKLFSEEKGLHALIAVIFSFLFMIVKPLRELIITITPWFFILFFLIFIGLILVMIFGFKETDVTKYLSENQGILTSIIIIGIIIFLLGLRGVFPGALGFPSENQGPFTELRRIIFHPKLLGVLLIFIITFFIIRAVGFSSKK